MTGSCIWLRTWCSSLFVLLYMASSGECCDAQTAPAENRSPDLIRICAADRSGKVEIDLGTRTLTAFGLWMGDQPGNWGLLRTTISKSQIDSVVGPLNQADLSHFTPPPVTAFQPVDMYIDEGPAILILTWRTSESVFALCPGHALESAPKAVRETYSLFLDSAAELYELQFQYWKGPFCTNKDRDPAAQVLQVSKDNARYDQFRTELYDAFAKSLPKGPRNW